MASYSVQLPPMTPAYVPGMCSMVPPWSQPNPDVVIPIRRTRTSKPKVRSGCVTCKVRRVKCDESKPACHRCTTTGRKCDGYAETRDMRQKKSRCDTPPSLPLRRNPDLQLGTTEEKRALDFFYVNTAPQLAGYFDNDFWTRLIFQMSHAEAAIRHAMIALGTLSERRTEDPRRVPLIGGVIQREKAERLPNPTKMNLPLTRPKPESEVTFALMHYNKAIKELAARVQSTDIPIETVLLACILFVCLEFMRGDVQPALKHFQSGMGVALASLTDSNALTRAAAQRIRQNMLPFFNRLELLSIVLGHPTDWEYATRLEDAVPNSFGNMREARDSLVHIQNFGIRFVRANGLKRYANLDMSKEHIEQRLLLDQLEKWRIGLEALLQSGNFSTSDLDGARVLRVHYLLAKVWTGIALRGDECKNDEWIQDYDLLVTLAETIQKNTHKTADYLGQVHGSRFLFDMEIVSGLWFVVTKCRHPMIRRRAAAILKTTVRREGLYDAQLAGAVADCLMNVEEKGLRFLDGSQLPLECNRIHHTIITMAETTSPGIDKYYLTHYYKPNGLHGPLEALYEEIDLVQEHNR